MRKNVLISGGSGLVGSKLTSILLGKGYQVAHLSRSPGKKGEVTRYQWDVDGQHMDDEPLRWADAIIHLAGAGVADRRWSNARKKEIMDSRVMSTRLLYDKLSKLEGYKVKSFVSASAIGYYGFGENEWFLENSKVGEGFLAEVTKAWEDEIEKLGQLDFKLSKLRIGVVLSEKGGALAEMAKPVKFGAGAALGKGYQYISWVHIDDLCQMFIEAMENENVVGTYNAVAPNPVTNKELTKCIANVLRKPMFLPNVPSFIMKLMLGEMAVIVLEGSRVKSDKIESTGFSFQFTDIEEAVKDLLLKQ